MDYKIEKLDKCVMIKMLSPKLDIDVSSSLKADLVLLVGDNNVNMVFDLSECNYCDSSGLSAILVGNRLCNNCKGKFILSNLHKNVERLVFITQLDDVLNIVENVEEGLRLF